MRGLCALERRSVREFAAAAIRRSSPASADSVSSRQLVFPTCSEEQSGDVARTDRNGPVEPSLPGPLPRSFESSPTSGAFRHGSFVVGWCHPASRPSIFRWKSSRTVESKAPSLGPPRLAPRRPRVISAVLRHPTSCRSRAALIRELEQWPHREGGDPILLGPTRFRSPHMLLHGGADSLVRLRSLSSPDVTRESRVRRARSSRLTAARFVPLRTDTRELLAPLGSGAPGPRSSSTSSATHYFCALTGTDRFQRWTPIVSARSVSRPHATSVVLGSRRATQLRRARGAFRGPIGPAGHRFTRPRWVA